MRIRTMLLAVTLAVAALIFPAAVAAQDPAPAKLEISGAYTLVRSEFNNHSTSVTAVTPVSQRFAAGFTFLNVPTVGKGYFGRGQYRRNLADLKIPASAQFNPKYFDVVAFAEAGIFQNAGGKRGISGRIGAALDFTPEGSDVTIRVFEYSRLRSSIVQGPLTFRNNNLISAGINWRIGGGS